MRKVLFVFLLICLLCFCGCYDPYSLENQRMKSPLLNPSREWTPEIGKDDFRGSTRYAYYPGRYLNETRFEASFIEDKDGKQPIFSSFYCVGLHWIFVERVYIKVDNSEPIFIESISSDRRVINSLNILVLEWYFTKIDKQLLDKIANSSTTVIRFSGSRGVTDYEISKAEKEGLAWLLTKHAE